MSRRNQWAFLMLGSLSLAASQWLTLWLLARTAPPGIVGQYGLALGWLLPACALVALQLRPLMATEPHLDQRLHAYLRLRLVAMGSFVLLLVPLFWIEFPGVGTGALLCALGVSRLVELASDFVDALRHRDRSYFDLGVSQCCRSMAGFVAFCLVWLSMHRLVPAIMAATAAAFCSALLMDLPALRRSLSRSSEFTWCKRNTAPEPATAISVERSILVLAAPLAIVHFLNLGVIALPRLLLGVFSSLEAVAAFTCLASALGVASLLASAYTASLAPDLAEAFHAHKSPEDSHGGKAFPVAHPHSIAKARQLLVRASRNVCLGALPFVGILVIGGEPILTMLYGPEIEIPHGAIILTALFVAIWSLAAVFGTAATAARRIGLQACSFGLSLASGAIAGALLIPAHGVVGGSASLLVSATVLLAAYLFAFRRIWLLPRPSDTNLLTDARCGIVTD
ncbi:MAG: hypothetical protein KJZ70_11670 [Bryobacterales bacterium]|nr:hypothetical protein [Bryobacterales bacterium]